MKDKDTKFLEEAYDGIASQNVLFKNSRIEKINDEITEITTPAKFWERYYKFNFDKERAYSQDIETSDGYVWNLSDDGQFYITYAGSET
jgi:hypothetical protein